MSKNELNSSKDCSGYLSFQGSDDGNETVDLSKNGLKEVPEDLLEQNIHCLNLSRNFLTDVNEAFRRNLESLKELDLSENKLSEFHKPACSGSLKILDLSSNKMTSIPSWLYMDLTVKLDVLNFSDNKLSSEYLLHYSLKSHSITYLNLSNTNLTTENLCAIKHMMGLKKLDISSYRKTYAKIRNPNCLWNLNPADLPPKLEELIAQDTGLCSFPDFSSLPLLRALDLSENKFLFLYKDFPSMKNLQKLKLVKCGLSFLPENFGSLSSLLHVDLSHNNLGIFPESFSECKMLRHLDLYDNLIESPPEFLDDLTSLEKLDLSENYFKVPDICGTKDYGTLEANLRSELDEKRTNEIKVFVEEEYDSSTSSSSRFSDYSSLGSEAGAGNTEEIEGAEYTGDKEEEVWGDDADDFVPYEVHFNSDCYDSDDSLKAYIAQCPPEIKFSKNFWVPAASTRESKEVKMARRKAMEFCFPPPVPGQFDDA